MRNNPSDIGSLLENNVLIEKKTEQLAKFRLEVDCLKANIIDITGNLAVYGVYNSFFTKTIIAITNK